MVADLIVGRYEIIDEGPEKRRAIDRLTGREVLVRTKPLESPSGEALLERLVRLRHPNLAALLHHFELDGELFLISEYVEGPSLETVLSGPQRPDGAKARIWLTGLAAATRTLHEAGLLVSALSPGNVLVSQNDTPKILDAGFRGSTADAASIQAEVFTLAAIYRRMLGDAANDDPALARMEAAQDCAALIAALAETKAPAVSGSETAPLAKPKKLPFYKKWDRRYVYAIIATLIGIFIGYKIATHGQS